MLTHPRQDHPRFASFSHVDDLPSSISLKKWFQASASTFWYVLDRERPLQLRLRTIYSIVTKSDNFYTNLYPFWWISLVFKTTFLFFTLPWLFCGLFINLLTSTRILRSFHSPWMTNLHKLPILNTAKNLTYHIPFSSQRGKMQFKFFSPVRGSVTKWRGGCSKKFLQKFYIYKYYVILTSKNQEIKLSI